MSEQVAERLNAIWTMPEGPPVSRAEPADAAWKDAALAADLLGEARQVAYR